MDIEQAVEQALADWKASLCHKIDIPSFFQRSPVAHKWKSPLRSLMLRESVFWRLNDLVEQSFALQRTGHILGARILLRSCLETVAILVYLNQQTAKVIAGTLDFHAFSDITSKLLLGSKNGSTKTSAVNIITVLGHCEKRYPGIVKWYGELSESVHPNHEGICLGYSEADEQDYITSFSNQWASLYGDSALDGISECMDLFMNEYQEVWITQMEALEGWLEANDAVLVAIPKSAS